MGVGILTQVTVGQRNRAFEGPELRPVGRALTANASQQRPRENADRDQLKRWGWNLRLHFSRETYLPQTRENGLKFLDDIPKVAQR